MICSSKTTVIDLLGIFQGIICSKITKIANQSTVSATRQFWQWTRTVWLISWYQRERGICNPGLHPRRHPGGHGSTSLPCSPRWNPIGQSRRDSSHRNGSRHRLHRVGPVVHGAFLRCWRGQILPLLHSTKRPYQVRFDRVYRHVIRRSSTSIE